MVLNGHIKTHVNVTVHRDEVLLYIVIIAGDAQAMKTSGNMKVRQFSLHETITN